MVSQHPEVERVRKEKVLSAIQRGLGPDWAQSIKERQKFALLAVRVCEQLHTDNCLILSIIPSDAAVKAAIVQSIKVEDSYRRHSGRSGPGIVDRIYAGLYARGYVIQ